MQMPSGGGVHSIIFAPPPRYIFPPPLTDRSACFRHRYNEMLREPEAPQSRPNSTYETPIHSIAFAHMLWLSKLRFHIPSTRPAQHTTTCDDTSDINHRIQLSGDTLLIDMDTPTAMTLLMKLLTYCNIHVIRRIEQYCVCICRYEIVLFYYPTMASKSEALGLRWEHVHGDRAALPDSKSGPRTIWLATPARAAVAAPPRRYIIPPPLTLRWKIQDVALLVG